MAINVGTLRSLSLNSRLFPVLPSFGSFAVLGPVPQCPGIIHWGLLHVPSFGQMCSLFAPISNLRARFLQLAPHADLSTGHKADNHFPHLTTDNLRFSSILYALPRSQCQEKRLSYSKVTRTFLNCGYALTCCVICTKLCDWF